MTDARADIFDTILASGGACGRLIAAKDWSRTDLGPLAAWPQSLRTAITLLLRSPVAMVVLWGEDGIMLYNDAYAALAGGRHPQALGCKVRDAWPEVADFNDHVLRVVLAGGTLHYQHAEFTLHRNGQPEQVFLTLDYSPLFDEHGRAVAVFAVVDETTERVLADRRMQEAIARFDAFLAANAGTMYRMSPDWRELRQLDGQGFLSDVEAPITDWLDVYVDVRDRAMLQTAIGQAIDRKGLFELEHRVLRTDGSTGWIYSRAVPILDDAGALVEWFGSAIDITARKQAEESLRSSEARLAAIFANATVGLSEVALDGHFLEANGELCRIVGRTRAELIGSSIADVTFPGDMPPSLAALAEAVETGRSTALDKRYVRPDGSLIWANSRITRLHDADGKPGNFLVVTVDLMERRGAEQALRESEERFRVMADAVPQIVWITDTEGRVEFFNRQWSDYTGVPYEVETAAQVAANYVHPDDGDATMLAFEEARRTGTPFRVEHRIRSASGEYRWFLVRAEPYRDPETGDIRRWFGASVDIHDRKLAEAGVRELNETLERRVTEALAERKIFSDVVESATSAIMVIDLDYTIMAINQANIVAFERVYGKRIGIGDNLMDVLADMPEHQAQVRQTWDRAIAGEEFVIVDEFGDALHERVAFEIRFSILRDRNGRQIAVSHTAYDVTDRVRAEAELELAQEALRQSQKMEAMGQLTGGVAHDFNNLLTPIVGSLDMLQRKGLGGEREQRLIAGAVQSAERAKTLVQRLLAFARRQPLQPVPVNIPQLVKGMGELVASTTGPQIQVVVEAPEDLPPAKADPNQLEMALLNLAVNARDAMPEGGKLRITARSETVDAVHASGLRSGRYICLSVADTGIGMDAETAARAVEPFFSTKGIGKGTGLGLSMVHGLASQLGGVLTIQSCPGLGTNVEFWLPESNVTPDQGKDTQAQAVELKTLGTALLVDDEELVRISTADMLADLGYSVVETETAEQALRMLRAGQTFDLLVTDHMMPGMTGTDLARIVRAERPGLPVLLVSGYADQGGVEFDLPRLAKPFRKDELAEMLSRL